MVDEQDSVSLQQLFLQKGQKVGKERNRFVKSMPACTVDTTKGVSEEKSIVVVVSSSPICFSLP